MPWREVTRMSLREEFVKLAIQPGANRRELCRRFGIAPKTGYKWLQRYAAAGSSGLEDRSRRPRRSPKRTAAEIEQRVNGLRREVLGSWGPRKLARRLLLEGGPKLAPSTITGILRRSGLLNQTAPAPRPFLRFERAAPNELWQMDYKGHFPFFDGVRCHPLTVLDDHSRFSLVLRPAPTSASRPCARC
jgi:transposase-like protein